MSVATKVGITEADDGLLILSGTRIALDYVWYLIWGFLFCHPKRKYEEVKRETVTAYRGKERQVASEFSKIQVHDWRLSCHLWREVVVAADEWVVISFWGAGADSLFIFWLVVLISLEKMSIYHLKLLILVEI